METKQAENRTKRQNNRGAFLMTHDGKIYNVPYNGGGLPELYRLINCDYVEAVRLRGPLAGLSIWCDEEGKLSDHCVNLPASLLYRYLCDGDYMAGRCVVLRDDPETGDAVPLTETDARRVGMFLAGAYVQQMGNNEKIEATGPKCEIIEL